MVLDYCLQSAWTSGRKVCLVSTDCEAFNWELGRLLVLQTLERILPHICLVSFPVQCLSEVFLVIFLSVKWNEQLKPALEKNVPVCWKVNFQVLYAVCPLSIPCLWWGNHCIWENQVLVSYRITYMEYYDRCRSTEQVVKCNFNSSQ